MFHPLGEPTTQTPIRPASATGRSRSVLLILVLLAALGAPLAGAAPAAAQADTRLELTPAKAVTEVNRPIQYTAYLIDANGRHLATTETTLDFGTAPCAETKAAPGEVSCSDNGLFHVTGFERYSEVSSEPVELRVVNVNDREGPAFTSPPASSPPNGEVTVEGSTGSCSQTGTLSSDRLKVDQQVASGFTARFRIPPGTFVGRYPLTLSVRCDGATQTATVEVTVANHPPDAVDDQGTVSPGGSVPIPVTKNDTDPDGDDGYATELEVDPPTVGTATVQGQDIVYTPGTGFVDGDQFTYRNCQVVGARGKRDCDTATVTITRPDPEPVNDPDATTEEETEVSILVTGNDTSPDPAKLRVRTAPTHGTAVVQQNPRNGHISYTPNKEFTGTDRFTYDYCEGVVVGPNVAAPDVCPFATVTVTVTKGKPVPVDDPDVTTMEGRTVDIDVMGNDRNGDADKLEIKPVQPKPKGTPAVLSDGKIQYKPAEGFTGKDSFQYDYCGPPVNVTAREDCPSATVTVDVQRRVPPAVKSIVLNPTPPNRKVVVTGTTGSCPEGTLILFIPPDTDVSAPVRAGSDGGFTASLEVPGGTLVETYLLTLRVDCDDQTHTTEARFQVANQAPDAVDDQASTPKDTPVTIDVTGNDTDPDGDEGYKTSLETTQPANGRTEVLTGDQIRYTPNPGFSGKDPFTYTFCDIDVDASGRKDCDKATVTVTVERPPVNPKIDSVDPEASPPNHAVVVNGTTGTCGKAARLTLDSAPQAAPPVPVTGGPDGGLEARLKIPPGTFVGPYQVELHAVCEGKPKVVAHKLKVANQPPQAADDPATTTMDTPVTIDVTGNDIDPDGDDGYLTSLDPGKPEHGTAVEQPGNRIRYRPEAGFTGEDRFSYRFCDLVDADRTPDCGAATVIVTVGKPPPEAADDAARTLRDHPLTIQVTSNDRHPDPAKLHVSRPPAPPATAVEQRQPPGSIRYTPAPGFTGTDTFQYDYCGSSVVVDAAGRAACTPATVTVTVAKPDPVPIDDADVTTVASQPVVVEVMGNDRDPDPSKLQLRPDPPAHGRPEPLPDGRVRYTPEPGQAGTDTFRYDYCRGAEAAAQAACPFATVTVTVIADPVIASVRPGSSPPGRTVEVAGNTGSCAQAGTLTLQGTGAAVGVAGDRNGGFTAGLAVPAGTFPGAYRLKLRVDCGGQARRAEAALTVTNRAPKAVEDAVTTTRDHPVTIPVTRNDRDPDDPDGHENLVLVTSPPAHGTAQVQPDQTILYTPASGFVGQDRFGYSLCDDVLNADGGADCGAATVTVSVTDTPVISSVTPGSTPPGQPVQVVGNTGSCNRLGTLIFHGPVDLPLSVSADENGSLATSLTIPAGTFPQPYRLELRVDCGGQAQLAEATLTVTNRAPEAVDDPATTTPDTPVTIDVTGNDRDPDDPDGYRNLVLVTTLPAHGTAEVQPDQTIVYTPASGFVGQDRFGYRLCDDVLNAAGGADCGSATVTVTVSGNACVPAGTPRLEVAPGKGPGGTRLRITAAVDRRLAACPLRFLLGGTPLGPDVRVGGDGSISADLRVPEKVKRGRSSVRLATLSAQTLAERPFEVVGGPIPWPVRLALGAGALLVGALARIAFRRWRATRKPRSGRRPAELSDVRAEPHTRPVEVGVEPVPDGTQTFALRLQPHADPGTQTLQEG
jgi:large repetitive protein